MLNVRGGDANDMIAVPDCFLVLGIDGVESVVKAHPLPVPTLVGRHARFVKGLIADRQSSMTLVVDLPTLLIA